MVLLACAGGEKDTGLTDTTDGSVDVNACTADDCACVSGESCDLVCAGVSDCGAVCGAGSTGTVDCADADNCGVTCGGSACSVDCASASACAVTCDGPCEVENCTLMDGCAVTCSNGMPADYAGGGAACD